MVRTSFACFSVAAGLFLALSTSACNLLKKKDKDKIKVSCVKESYHHTGSTRQCRDVVGEYGGCISEETESKPPCPKDALLVAGCRSSNGSDVEWFYSEPAKGGSATIQTVGAYCVDIAKGTALLPDGGVKSRDDVIADEVAKYSAQHGAKAKATLATVARIAAKLPAPTGKVNLEGLKGDVLLVHKEDLGNLESPKKIEYRVAEAGKLAACSRLLNGRKQYDDRPYEIENCANSPIIAVVSVTDYAPPTATGSSVSGRTNTTYVKKGRISGDALFFRSDNGKYLGSTTVGASNDDYSVTSPQIMTERLLEKWPGALHGQMKQAAPGVTNVELTLKKP